MVLFIILATVLVVVGAALILIPLIRPVSSQHPPARWAALGTCAVLALGSAVLYVSLSNYSWSRNPGVSARQSPIELLVHHLDAHPKDLDDWLKLGRSYVILQEYPLAMRAFAHANTIAHGRNAPALIGEAESMILIHDSALDGRAGRLIERALVLAPNSPKALFFGAAAAMRRGNLTLARARYSKLLAMNPPADVKTVLKREIAGINSKLASNVSPTAAKKN